MTTALSVTTLVCKGCNNPFSFYLEPHATEKYMYCATKRYGSREACPEFGKKYKIPEIEIEIEELDDDTN